MPNAVEAGIKSLRVHFLREVTTGVIPANPAWLRYSDAIMRVAESPNANVYQQLPVGYVDVAEFLLGPEDHELEVAYHLQNWVTVGEDAASDGLLRATDGAMLNTHAYLSRQSLITGGALAAGRRIYTVGVGGRIASVKLQGDPNTGEPMKASLKYVFEKLRSYEIAQPLIASVVTVQSTSALDITQTVKIENESAFVTASLDLTGVTPVGSGATTFLNIDSISLDEETVGDVVVKIGAVEICRILGKLSNGGYEGDLGVPALGTGSFEAAIGLDYEFIVGSSITRGGAPLEVNATVRTFEVNVENSLEVSPRIDSRRRRITEGVRKVTAVASIFSEAGSHTSFIEHLKATESDLVWTTVSGSLTLTSSCLTGLGGRVYESGAAVMTRSNTFTGKGIAVA